MHLQAKLIYPGLKPVTLHHFFHRLCQTLTFAQFKHMSKGRAGTRGRNPSQARRGPVTVCYIVVQLAGTASYQIIARR